MKKYLKLMSWLLVMIMIIGSAFPETSAYAAGVEIYVDAVNGNDNNSGTAESPFLSLGKAKETLGLRAGTVHIADGEYFEESALCWTEGSNGQLWKAEGKNVVITGGRKISSGWKNDTLNGTDCLSMVIDNASDQIMLYGKSKPLVNSRMPDEGYFYLKDGSQPSNDNGTFAANRAVITNTENTCGLGTTGQVFGEKARAFIRVFHYWMEELLVIGTFNASTGEIEFCGNYGTAVTICTSRQGDPYCLENVIAGFNKPGEWYMDYFTGKLYYIPQTGETADNTEVWMATTEQLININGADNITFEGIKFKNTNSIYKSNFSQSAYGSAATVLINNANGINFRNCEFINIGESAVVFGNWGNGNTENVSDCAVTGCLFNQIGASAVVIAGPNNDSLCPMGITVDDNLVMNYGRNRNQACGIFVTFANNVSVTHNEIHDGMYTGISCGWSWGYNKTCNHNNDISYNLIYNIGHGPMSDMGGIYVLGIQADSTMNNNVVYNVCAGEDATTYGGWGLYTDEGSQGWTIENNIAYDNGSQGFHQHYGYHNMVRNNIFAFNDEGQTRSSARWVSTVVTGNSDTSGENKRYSAQTVSGDQFYLYNDILVGDNQPMYHAYSDDYFTDDNCIYWDITLGENVISAGDKVKKKKIQNSGNTNNYGNGVFEDPCFIDYTNRNFGFSDKTTISRIDFKEIDVSYVGSSSFCSSCLVNHLSNPKGFYDNELWNNWEEAKNKAVRDRNEAACDELKTAYDALSSLDEYSSLVIPFDRYCFGEEYVSYFSVYEQFVKEILAGNSVSESTEERLRNAYEGVTSKTYIITLDSNGGTGLSENITYTIADGNTVILPEPVSSDASMFFAGWKRDTDNEVIGAGQYSAGCGSYKMTAQWEKSNNIFKILLHAIQILFSRISNMFAAMQ